MFDYALAAERPTPSSRYTATVTVVSVRVTGR